MKAREMRGLSNEELEHQLDERVREYFNLRFQAVTEQIENSSQIPHVKRDIARMKTVLRERQREGANEAARQ